MNEGEQLIKLARELERLMHRRRLALKKLAELDDRLRTTRKFLRDLAGSSWSVAPDTVVLTAGPDPLPGTEEHHA
ncbi:MAG: hypothetical protein AUH33_04165 [Chloroflexi bacterium 13_1_40CM_68_21]|nr:MAG: hypothetical protein AUH33_04165 [Chloroflexi bacterium 13_1_40CM_68_21]